MRNDIIIRDITSNKDEILLNAPKPLRNHQIGEIISVRWNNWQSYKIKNIESKYFCSTTKPYKVEYEQIIYYCERVKS